MNLVYVRHGIAMDRLEFAHYCLRKGLEPDDELRPLTGLGVRRMERAASGLVSAFKSLDNAAPPLIVASPLKRSLQTAEIVRRAFGARSSKQPASTCEALRPSVDPVQFRNWLYDTLRSGASRRITHQQTIIAIGHEPELSKQVAWWLSGEGKSKYPIKKGGAICLEIGNAMRAGQARMMWALPPWALRALGH